MSVDESKFSHNDTPLRKEILTADNFKQNPNPFLMAGSFISSGFGTAVVCCVGEHVCFREDGGNLEFESVTPT